jgi:hypothetical protein
MTHLCSVEVPSPVIKKPVTCPDALDVMEIDRCCGYIYISVGTPVFQR